MFEQRFCPYCGTALSDGCNCAQAIEEYKNEFIEELEDRQYRTAWQQDLIDLHRYER